MCFQLEYDDGNHANAPSVAPSSSTTSSSSIQAILGPFEQDDIFGSGSGLSGSGAGQKQPQAVTLQQQVKTNTQPPQRATKPVVIQQHVTKASLVVSTAATAMAPSTPIIRASNSQIVLGQAIPQQPQIMQIVQQAKSTPSTSKQPQLLPKPATSTQQIKTLVSTATATSNVSAPLILSQANPPVLINNLQIGQVQASPILIQQPNGVFVLRQQAPTTNATNQILLQQQPVAPAPAPATPAPQITAQPQVKIITPQGRMQMQQIQTPSGPQLIAVPVQQTSTAAMTATTTTTVMTPSTSVTPESLIAAVANRSMKKKSKKAKKTASSPEKAKQSLDLGELMKDVGLDIENSFGASSSTTEEASISSELSTQHPIAPPPVSAVMSSGSQLLAQIQQPLPMQNATTANNQQYQLVPGSDGQFVLQPTTTIIAANAPDASHLIPQVVSFTTAAPQLPTTPVVTKAPSTTNPTSPTKTTPVPSTGSPSINREPLYEDDRLPPFWHRRVSQRKSGASAGRYEVFIIGPTGKRFRSRNELKAFFEKTGEKQLDPEEFDFTPYGNGRTTNNPMTTTTTITTTTTTTSMTTTPIIIPTTKASSSSTSASNLLQSIQEPLPPKSLEQPQPEATPVPVLTSQISRETAEADAQISQLLETLQKNPQSIELEHDKVADFMKSFESESGSFINAESPATVTTSTPTPAFPTAPFLQGVSNPDSEFFPAAPVRATPTVPTLPTTPIASTQKNARIVRGPNGHYSLQKVQTIELTPQMQSVLKNLHARVQELENRGARRTPQEEAELAQLHSRQQQILATGKTIENKTQTTTATSLSTDTRVVNATNSTPDPSLANLFTPSTPSPSSSSIPPLTDQQKKIVHEFKQKMSRLPPEQQTQFISQNKAALIKQLNFQPNQLQLLRNNQLQQQQRQQQQRPTPQQQPQQPPPPQQHQQQPIQIGVKRPMQETPPANVSSPSALKQKKLLDWVESQIKKDQNEAVNPNYKAQFRSKEDACKKLLRFHVFDELDEETEAEAEFECKSKALLARHESMLSKYHLLLLKESTRKCASSEEVMLARMWDTDERQTLARQKEQVKSGEILELPPPPDAWREKLDEFISELPSPLPAINTVVPEQATKRINAASSDDEDQDFSLKDIDTAAAAYAESDDEADEEESDANPKDNDSVQNAINSILGDLPQGERIETPDLNNIAGLWDSLEEGMPGMAASAPQNEHDPVTEAAVNSIMQ